MSQHYNQNYTKEQIEAILLTIQDCVRRNRFIISKNENRRENIDFINNYNLSSAKQKDFCHSLQNTKEGYEYETLYVFCPQMKLFNFDGDEELVDIYTKFNIIEYDSGKKVITVSFHKRNKPLDYLFR
jgi:hypothetical protein